MTSPEKVASLKMLAAQAVQQLPQPPIATLPAELIEFFQNVQFANQTAEYHQAESARLVAEASDLVNSLAMQADGADEDALRAQADRSTGLISAMEELLSHIQAQNEWITEHGGSLYENLHGFYEDMVAALYGQIAVIRNIVEFIGQ